MGGTRALCRSRISWGELLAGRNIVYTSWGAGERDPELEKQFGLPQKPCLGVGMLGSDRGDSSRQRGQQHPDTVEEVVAGSADGPRFVIWAVHSSTACLHAWIALLPVPNLSLGLSSAPLLSLISHPRASAPTSAVMRQGCASTTAPSSPQGSTWPLWSLSGGRQSSTEQKSILIIK